MDIGFQDNDGTRSNVGRFRPMYGPQTQSRNRNQIAVPLVGGYNGYDASGISCASSCIWLRADKITELTFCPTFVGAALDDWLDVVINAPSDAIAVNWLTEGEDAETDRLYYKILLNQYTTIQFTNYVTRIDMAGVSCTPDVWVGAN